MKAHTSKIVGEGLTYDDVLLIPNYSEILPREVCIQSKFSRNITLNVPVASADCDCEVEDEMRFHGDDVFRPAVVIAVLVHVMEVRLKDELAIPFAF